MDIQTTAEEMIGTLDQLINRQLNHVMHHVAFQQLESAWHGLAMVVKAVTKSQRVKVRYLHLPMKALYKDLTSSSEFDQSQIFKKIFIEELDQPGGEPFGLLIGDYYISHLTDNVMGDSMECLRHLAKVLSAAFVPFVTSVAPQFFGLDSYAQLQSSLNLERLLQSNDYHRWQRLRAEENAHFIGLVLPRILMRKPYNTRSFRVAQRFFVEEVKQHEDYLWGNACYAYASVVIRCFEESGWFMNIRGASIGTQAPSMFELPRTYFESDQSELLPKISTECLITDRQEKRLNDAGFIAVRDHHHAAKSVFYSSQSIKIPKRVRDDKDVASAKINSMLHYVFCASRFAHYIKVIMREKIGAFIDVEACETYLTNWLNQYCSAAKGQSLDAITKRPLTRADVNVSEIVGSPGKYFCAMMISPHSQFDDIESQLRLTTNVRLK